MKNGPSRSTQSDPLFWLSAGRSSKRFRPRKRPLTAIVLFWYRSGRRTRLSSDTQPVSPVFSRGGSEWKDQKKKPPTSGINAEVGVLVRGRASLGTFAGG